MPTIEQKAVSLDEQSSMVRHEFMEFMRKMMPSPDMPMPCWVMEVYADYIVVCEDMGEYYKVPYTTVTEPSDEGGMERGFQFTPKDQWVKVEKDWIEAKGLEPLIYLGSDVKALGNGKVAGYLVQYTTPADPDASATRDYFDAKSDLDIDDGAALSVYYDHGLDPTLKTRKLGRGTVQYRDAGLWFEAQLELRDAYEEYIYKMVEAGKLGWSTGPAQHLVRREPVGKSNHMVLWPVKEASLTVAPAEYRNTAVPLKSLPIHDLESAIKSLPISTPETPNHQPEAQAEGGQPSASGADTTVASGAVTVNVTVNGGDPGALVTALEHKNITISGVKDMADENQNNTPPADNSVEAQLKALATANEQMSKQLGDVLKFMQETPAIANSGYLSHTGGASDQQVKSLGDFFLSVITGDEVRLNKVYGSFKAINTQTGQEGGYAVPTEYNQRFLQAAKVVSPILARVEHIPVTTVAGEYPFLDVYATPEAGQSAASAKLKSTKRAETGSYTETEPEFSMLEFKVNSQGGYIPVSRRATRSIPMLESLITTLIGNSQAHKYEYLVLNGTGNGEPLGIRNADAAIAVDGATDDVFALVDASNMVAKLKMWGGRVSWAMHRSTIPDLHKLEVGTGGAVWLANLTNGGNSPLLDFPIDYSEHLPQANSSGHVLLCDWSAYGLFEFGPLTVDYSEHALFTSGQNVWRFDQELDGKPLFKNTVKDSSGYTYSPFIVFND